jgi:hypothetical protein
MSIELNERLRRLGEFAISEPRPVERIAARGRQIQHRRRVLTASLLVLLLVGTVAGIATALGGDSRINVASSHKELGKELRHLSGYVVPKDASASTRGRVQQALERSAVVEQYVTMPPGWASVRLVTEQCQGTSCPPVSTAKLALACAALRTGSFAVQMARVPDAANRLRDALGGDGTLYTKDDVGDVELWMSVGAGSAETTRVRAAIAADPDIASYRFLDHQAQYDEFKKSHRDEPKVVASVLPTDLPESFRLYLSTSASPATVRHRYERVPGVQYAVATAHPLIGLLDDAYLRWLQGRQSPGAPAPTAPPVSPGPAVDPCGTTR